MRSSLIIDIGGGARHRRAFDRLLEEVHALVRLTGGKAQISFQNNLKEDVLGIMVEFGEHTFGAGEKTFPRAVSKTIKDIRAFRKAHGDLHQKAKQTAGKKNGPRRRRARAAG